jgi:hypothetical protein
MSEFRVLQVGTANPIWTLHHFGAQARPPTGYSFETFQSGRLTASQRTQNLTVHLTAFV